VAGVAPQARELLARDVSPEEYREIRELWKAHSIAEDKRDIAGLIATLTPDCVYEVVGEQGARWEGHAGATQFYLSLLGAFPDIHFDLQQIVIGPQGVCEEAIVTGTQKANWLSHAPSGDRVEFRVVIFFPWDPHAKKFKGERVYAQL
jgi:predicted ester cyclase